MLLLIVAALVRTSPGYAHGESVRGVGGAGVNTTGGEVSTGSSVYLRYDLRRYSLFSDAQLGEFQRAGENVHQHSREHSAFLGATAGIFPRLDMSFLLQANRFENFTDNGDAFARRTSTLSRTDVSQGIGDLLLLGRYQFAHWKNQRVAAIGGVKLPTGNFRQRTNQGEIVGTHNQPGSGSIDFQVGAGYSGDLGDRLVLSADTLFRINSGGAGSFRSGNSIQADVAAGVRVCSVLVPSVELNAFFQERDVELDLVKKNSGIYSLFLTPGLRTSFGPHSVFVAASVPLWQAFAAGVISNTERVRTSLGYSFSFGNDRGSRPALAPAPPAPRVAPR